MRPDQAEADERIRLDRSGRHEHHEIGHEVKDAVVLAGCFAEEMRRVTEVGLDAEDAASAAERDAKIGTLLLTVRKTRTVRRVAAEIEPDIRRHETISAGRPRRRQP